MNAVLATIVTITSITSMDGSLNLKGVDTFWFNYNSTNVLSVTAKDSHSLTRMTSTDVINTESYLCQSTATITLFIKDYSLDYQTMEIDCTKTGDYYYIRSFSNTAGFTNYRYQINFSVSKITQPDDSKMIVQIKDLLGVTKPQDVSQADEIIVYFKSDATGMAQCPNKDQTYFKLKRNGIVRFANYSMICNKILSIWLREIDTTVATDQYTDKQDIDCTVTGPQLIQFNLTTGKDTNIIYSILIDIKNATKSLTPTYLNELGQGSCGAKSYQPFDIDSGISIVNRYNKSSKVVKLNTLINKAGANDATNTDEIKVHIYSDVLEQLFTCGSYSISQGGLINFKGLEVPCNEYLIIMVVEQDVLMNDGYALRVSCSDTSNYEQGYDFQLAGGDTARVFGTLVNIIKVVEKVAKVAKVSATASMVCLASEFVLSTASSYVDEKDAIYSLSLNVLSQNTTVPYYNSKLEAQYCGASSFSVNQGSNSYIADWPKAPKVLILKYILGIYGTNDYTNFDEIYVNIYSDYLDEMIGCGVYELDSLGFIYFNDLEIPCTKEIIITLYEDDTIYSESYTVRVPCNNTGSIRRQFNLAAFKTSPYAQETDKVDDLPFVLDIGLNTAATISNTMESNAIYIFDGVLSTTVSNNGSSDNLDLSQCGAIINGYSKQKQIKGYVTIEKLQLVEANSTKQIASMNVFSDAYGFVSVFKNNEFQKGLNYTVNGSSTYKIPCYDKVILQLFSLDNDNVHQQIIDCDSNKNTTNQTFIWGLEKVPFSFDLKIDYGQLLLKNYTPQFSVADKLDLESFSKTVINQVISKGVNKLTEIFTAQFSIDSSLFPSYEIRQWSVFCSVQRANKAEVLEEVQEIDQYIFIPRNISQFVLDLPISDINQVAPSYDSTRYDIKLIAIITLGLLLISTALILLTKYLVMPLIKRDKYQAEKTVVENSPLVTSKISEDSEI